MHLIRAVRFLNSILHHKNLKLLERHMYFVLLIPLFLIAYDFAKPGISIAGDFPYLDTPDYAYGRLWLWIEKGSIDGFEFVSRFPIIGLMYILSYIGINSELASKAMVLLGFALSSFSFYISYLLFFRDKLGGSETILRFSAIVGSFFYAYNVWAFNRIHHWYLWIGYSLLPLFFISVYLYFRNPRDWKYLVLSVFLWSVASSTPHMTLFYGIVFVSMFLGFAVQRLYKRRFKLTSQLGLSLVLIITCYVAVNFYWIYPYYLASGSQVLTPNYELTKEIVELLSRESNFLNTFGILAYWLNSDVGLQENTISHFFWTIASIVIPVAAFSALFFRKSLKYALIFSAVALIGIVFAMGTYSPLEYYNLVLSTPVLGKFAWLLRDSDKLSFLITFAYSFLLGMVSHSVYSILAKVKIKERKNILISSSIIGLFSFLVVGSIYFVSYPFYETRTDALQPVTLPIEFDRLNEYLSTIHTDKIFFMPYPSYETSWNNKSRVGDIYNTHSIKPSIESSEYNNFAKNYYNYMVNSIIENRSNNIGNLIHPLGTSYVVFHNDTWDRIRDTYDRNSIELLKKIYFLEDIKNVKNIGFYKIFETMTGNNSRDAGQLVLPSQNIAVLSGLDALASLNAITYDSLQSSVFFLGDVKTKESNAIVKSIDKLILNRLSTHDEFALYFVKDKYLIAPFDATYSFEPTKNWSKAGLRDPTHAEFHPYVNRYGIENWDLDYGKGVVMTSFAGAKISIPIEIKSDNGSGAKDDHYNLLVRYFKNQKGGLIKIYLDNNLINKVDTLDKISNNFVTEMVNSSVNLAEGKHTLTIENVLGFNVVNALAIIPPSEMDRIDKEVGDILTDKKQLVYLLEAESNFYNNKGTDKNFTSLFFGNDSSSIESNDKNNTPTKTIEGQFKVPPSSDLVVLQFIGRKNHALESNYSARDLDVRPAYKEHNVFTSNFEINKESVPLATLRHSDWINEDKDLISTSFEINEPLHGNRSLNVQMQGSNKTGWNILSTDLIPIDGNAYYNATLEVSARDVNQLHSRIQYYDLNEKRIEGTTHYVFEHKEGNFRDAFTSNILPPLEAKYLQFEVLTLSANAKPSSYIIDDVKLDEITDTDIFANLDSDNADEDRNTNVNKKNSLNADIGNSTHFLIQSAPISVKENRLYNYTFIANSENIPAYYGAASFRNSNDVTQDFTRYDNNASGGGVLSLDDHSEIVTDLNIIKPSNYTIAIKAKTCQSCTFLTLKIVGGDSIKENEYVVQTSNITLSDESTGLHWKYTNSTRLEQGKYELRIYSNSQADIDSVVIYTNRNDEPYMNHISKDSKELNLFRANKNLSSVYISEYEKINPTKYLISIKNATNPYVLGFAESYDPLWSAYAENNIQNNDLSYDGNNLFKVNSIPLYSVVNGFPINKTGDYNLVIEYEPQIWFVQGATLSIIAIAMITMGIFIFATRKTLTRLLKILEPK